MRKSRQSFSLLAGLCLLAGALPAADTTTFWIEPCTAVKLSCVSSDMDLARWAFAEWEKASEGRLHFVETRERSAGTFRVLWAGRDSGLFGEAVPILVNGHYGSELHILVPEPTKAVSPTRPHSTLDAAVDDSLLRDTIVYLTCLHESGHALGLQHTREFADIMYSFQFGGDIDEYFGRYRRKLTVREDIRQNPGMSPADKATLLERIPKTVPR